MTQEELTAWALGNGWQKLAGVLSLTKPSNRKEAIVRLVLKATVATVEVKKPAGKWEKFSSAPYAKVAADAETGLPQGLEFEHIPGFTMLMRDNKDAMVFSGASWGGKA